MTLQEEMLEFRAKHNMSQEIASQMAKVSLFTWNQVELGKQTPHRMTEIKIRNVMKEVAEES